MRTNTAVSQSEIGMPPLCKNFTFAHMQIHQNCNSRPTVQYNTIQHISAEYNTVLFSTVQYRTNILECSKTQEKMTSGSISNLQKVEVHVSPTSRKWKYLQP